MTHHIRERFPSQRDLIDLLMAQDPEFFAYALKRLKDAGLDDHQIEVKTSDELFNPGKAIIEEAKQGGYGTILIGRRGISKASFIGSVSRYVVNQITDKALWIVP